MTFRSKMTETYAAIKSCGKKSLDTISKITKHSKSSTHRQLQNIKKRSKILGATFFETSDGALWLRRLVIAVVLVFGLQGNVGEGIIALFFQIICITEFIGLSARSVGRLKHDMMHLLKKYQSEIQPKLDELAAHISIVAGADETFFDRLMILLFMDLSSGYIFVDKIAQDRKATTWNNVTQPICAKFKELLCLTSDRGKSLVKLAKIAKTKSIAELFHLQDSIVRLFKFAFAAKRRSLQKQHKALAKKLDKLIANKAPMEIIQAQENMMQEIQNRNTLINEGQNKYREQLKVVSTATHPFDCFSQPKTSAILSQELQSSLTILQAVAKECNINDKNKHLNYFENNISNISQLVDLWWRWIDADLARRACTDELVTWLKVRLLSLYYWKQQIKKSRGDKALVKYYKELCSKAEAALHADPLTKKYLTSSWISWAKTWVLKFQRSSSQVEGHNARLSETHHCLRGISELHLETDAILNNCWITQQDGTTATERLFNFKPPDLFEWLVINMDELPLPRHRKKKPNSDEMLLQAILAV